MAQQRALPYLLAFAAAIPAVLQAQPPLGAATPQIIIAHRDLDLTNAGDVRLLHDRVRRTAASLCANDAARDLKSKQATRQCIDATVADAARAEAGVIAQAETQAAALREARTLARR